MPMPRTYLFVPFSASKLWAPLVSLLVLLGLLGLGVAEWGMGRMWPLTALVGGVLVVFLLGALTERVYVSNTGITYRSLGKKFHLNWTEIQQWGYFRSARYGNVRLGPGDALKGHVFLYVERGTPADITEIMRVDDHRIVVYFRPALAALFEEKIGAPPSTRKG